MKGLMIVIFFLCIACGKNRSNECKSKEHMQLECQTVNTPSYGYPYAKEMCNRSYSSDRCY